MRLVTREMLQAARKVARGMPPPRPDPIERDGITPRAIGKVQASLVTSELLENHFDRLEQEGLQGSTINKLRQTLRTIYNKARKRNVWRGPNPVLDTEPRPERAIKYFVLELKQLSPTLAHIQRTGGTCSAPRCSSACARASSSARSRPT